MAFAMPLTEDNPQSSFLTPFMFFIMSFINIIVVLLDVHSHQYIDSSDTVYASDQSLNQATNLDSLYLWSEDSLFMSANKIVSLFFNSEHMFLGTSAILRLSLVKVGLGSGKCW